MKQTAYIRPMLAGLALAVASSVTMAQTANAPTDAQVSKPAKTQQAHAHHGHDRQHAKHHGHGRMDKKPMPGMFLPSALLSELNLDEAQKAKYFDAQTQSQAIKKAMHESFKQARLEQRAQADTKFDPKQLFERQNQRFEKMQAARVSVQKQWLGFWDSLTAAQKDTIQKHFAAKRDEHKNRRAS